MLALLILQLSLFSSIRALGIFIPLYVGPGPASTCSGWLRVISSISENPQTPFFSIVNPNDGPGAHGSQPSDAFRQCIQPLRPHPNAIVLGHINTETGSKSISNVRAEIDTYAGWDLSYRPTGIFFDRVPSEANLVSRFGSYATYARGKGFSFIGLDPGEMPDPGYFSVADFVNVYESLYASFNADDDVISTSSTPTSKQTVWLTEAPAEGSYNEVISQMVKKGIAAMYISDLSEEESGIPKQWASFAAAVGKANKDMGITTSPATNLTLDPSHTSNPGTSTSGVSNAPQETGDSTQQASNHKTTGAIVGGTLGGVGGLLIVLLILMFTCRNKRRRDQRVVGEEVARPFVGSQPPPSEFSRHALREKWHFNGQGSLNIGESSSWGGDRTPTTFQSGPSSSGRSDGQPGFTVDSATSTGSPSKHRASNAEPPPYYIP